MAHPGGRPPTAQRAFDQKVFEALLAVQATRDEVLTYFGISEASLRRIIRATYGRGTSFDALRKERMTFTKLSIRRKVLAAALAPRTNNTLLKFAAQTFGEMSERHQVTEDPDQFDRRLEEQKRRDEEAAAAAAKAATREDARVAAIMALLRPTTAATAARA
jgi:hypothetical protein